RQRPRKLTKERTDQADHVTFKDAHPPIVDRETFDRAQRKMDSLRWRCNRRATPIPGGGEWVLSGLLHCADCDGRMHGVKNTHKRGNGRTYTYRKYVCGSARREGRGTCHGLGVHQDAVLRELAATLRDLLHREGGVEALTHELAEESRAASGELEREAGQIASRLVELDVQIRQAEERLLVLPEDVALRLVPRV